VPPSRPFPLDDHQRALRRDAPADGAYATAAATGSRTWPVLAQIGDVESGKRRVAPTTPSKAAPAAPRSYRIDSPHVTVAAQPTSGSTPQATSVAPATNAKPASQRPKRFLHRLPALLRFAIRTWLFLHPYRSLIRAGLMFLAMAITGAGTMVMVAGSLQPETSPPDATSTVSDKPVSSEAASHTGTLQPAVAPVVPPEVPTTSAAPTTLGPLSDERRELVAVRGETDPQSAESADNALPVVVYPVLTYSTSTPSTPIAVYPTTPYDATPLPTEDNPMPRVQTSEPPQSVARFEGGIERAPLPR
jgi:hypothetical protein